MAEKKAGIVITGGHPPRSTLRFTRQEEVFVIAADSGLEFALEMGVEPDLVVGDMDSLSDLSLLDRFPTERVDLHPSDKDLTDTELALEMMWSRGIEDVTLVGGGGGRLDHLLGIVRIFDRERYPRRWFTDKEMVICFEDTIEFSAKVGETVSFLPAGCELCTMSSSGFKWNLDGLAWKRGDFGISNEVVESRCRVDMQTGRLLLVRQLPEEVELP